MRIFFTRTVYSIILLFFLYHTSTAQVKLEWDKTYGGSLEDNLYSTTPTSDGGFLLAGYSSSNTSGDKSDNSKGEEDFWIIKTDATGQKIWDKTFGGDKYDGLKSVLSTQDGGFLLAGSSVSNSSGDKTDNSKGLFDYWIIKLDAHGNKVWDKTYGGSSNDLLTSLAPTKDGGYLLGGFSTSDISGDKSENSVGDQDYWVVKLDATGNKQWDKTYGGTLDDYLISLVPLQEGGTLLAGYSYSEKSGHKSENSKGEFDYWVLKMDAFGNKLWDKTIGSDDYDFLNTAIATPDGGFLLAGESAAYTSGDKTENSKGFEDYWVVKLDAKGNKQWDKTLGGNLFDNLISVIPSADGSYLLAGHSASDISGDKSEGTKGGSLFSADYWLVKVDAIGNKVWDKTLGGESDDYVKSIVSSADGGFLLSGFSTSNASGNKTENSKGEADYWVIKLKEPSKGLITGGGWFHSPSGALTQNSSLKDKAFFNFVIQQELKDDAPKGNLTFNFPGGQLWFISEDYSWLTINKRKGIYKGKGFVNGTSGYSFLVSLVDHGHGKVKDAFRIVIWDKEGDVLYDNQKGSELYAEATTKLEGGSIVIHGKKEKSIANHELQSLQLKTATTKLEGFQAYPVPLDNDGLWLNLPASQKEENLQVVILDIQGRKMAEKNLLQGQTDTRHLWKLAHENWPSGMYILQVKGDQLLHQQKIIK